MKPLPLFARSLFKASFSNNFEAFPGPPRLPAMPAKRVGFAAGLKAQGPTTKAGRTGDRMLVACARSWGSGRWVFEGWSAAAIATIVLGKYLLLSRPNCFTGFSRACSVQELLLRHRCGNCS